MKITIDSGIFNRFPGLHVGVVAAKNIDNNGAAGELEAALREEEKRIRGAFSSETLPLEPKIDSWRKAYSVFGGEPKKNRSSVENLHRLILNGSDIRHINPLVDAYNLVSLKHTLPVGGEDLDKMQGDICLRFASANEPAVLLLGDKDARPPKVGEVIYADATSAICRRWNWREAERTKLTEATRNCILVVEGLPPAGKEEVEKATQELEALVSKHCGGTRKSVVLCEGSSEFLL